MKILLPLLLMLCVGCAGTALTERKVTGASAQAIQLISNKLDDAEKSGQITQAQETKYQNKLLDALEVLEGARGYASLPECSESASSIECADTILAYLEVILQETK